MNVNIPKRRFKGFSENWEQKKFSNMANIVGGGTPSTKESSYWNGDINWFTPNEIGDSKYVKDSLRQITEKGLNNSSAQLLPANKTILFTSRATIGTIGILEEEASTNQGFQSLIVNDFNDVNFLYYKLLTMKKLFLKNSVGSTFLEISGKTMKKIDINIPSKTEQEKIGKLLSKIDKAISLHKRKFEKLKQLQKSYLNESILSEPKCVPKRRFKGFIDEWGQEKLKNISTVSSCKRIYKNETHELGEIPFYKIGTIGKKPDSYITREIFENYKQNYDYPDYGDTIITASGSIGRLFQYQGEEAYFQDSNLVWLNFKLEMNKDYTYYYLNRIRWAVEGTTITRLYNKNILSSIFKYPNLEEQKKIAKLLNTIDKTISLHKHKHNAIKILQKIYLQNNLEDETYA